jgi:class 3 adenylate cyclase
MDEQAPASLNDPRIVYDQLRTHIAELHANAPQVAVLFADLVSSTEYKAQRELITALLKVHIHNSEIENHIRDAGGIVVKSLGDGVMATFALDDRGGVARAVDAAVGAQREFATMNRRVIAAEQVESRIGIAAGPVVNFLTRSPQGTAIGDPHGSTVDRAARLCSLAAPSQIICDENVATVLRAANSSHQLSPAAVRRLKGFAAAMPVYAVRWREGSSGEEVVPFPAPTYHESGFLTPTFVMTAVEQATRFVRVAGFTNRHYCDNVDLLNLLRAKTSVLPEFRFELIFLNPQSRFKHYAAQITRRRADGLVPAIRRNVASACRTFGALPSVSLLYATYPMSIPCVQSDDTLYFSVPFWSAERDELQTGVIGGPYFAAEVQSDIGQRIIGTIERDEFVRIDAATVRLSEGSPPSANAVSARLPRSTR